MDYSWARGASDSTSGAIQHECVDPVAAALPGDLVTPARLWTADEVRGRPSPIPAQPGVYAWYFTLAPPGVPTADCQRWDGSTLLYVGISPKAPPRDGGRPSRQNLRRRIRYHYRGNAAGSTLRLSLGCLLATELGIELRRVGSGERLTFAGGEQSLAQWMAANARVCWHVVPEPWLSESALVGQLSLPFNLDQNSAGPFRRELSALRAQCRAKARAVPVLST
jgi:hypothetical protein